MPLHTREEHEKREQAHLAPYAARGAESLGRAYPESRHDYRPVFQRDRDRILYSPCFRRLEYKTQVFVNGTADHYRTRLTHTMEMTAVGRTMARALSANEDLAEAIALAHDIGHSPFGHCGERALDELMKNEGGFDHNTQSLRWVERLEQPYPDFPGLNLTWEVRAGLRKHAAATPGETLDGRPIGPFQYLEAQIADVADDITYHAHDTDDGLDAGLITYGQLEKLELWNKAVEHARAQFPGMTSSHLHTTSVRALLNLQVHDVLETSMARLDEEKPESPHAVMNRNKRMIAFSETMAAMLEPFRAFLAKNMYYHPSVAGANDEAVEMMSRLFLYYIEHPDDMGSKARKRIEEDGLWRAACDYISGMTDRYAIEEYDRFGLGNADHG